MHLPVSTIYAQYGLFDCHQVDCYCQPHKNPLLHASNHPPQLQNSPASCTQQSQCLSNPICSPRPTWTCSTTNSLHCPPVLHTQTLLCSMPFHCTKIGTCNPKNIQSTPFPLSSSYLHHPKQAPHFPQLYWSTTLNVQKQLLTALTLDQWYWKTVNTNLHCAHLHPGSCLCLCFQCESLTFLLAVSYGRQHYKLEVFCSRKYMGWLD